MKRTLFIALGTLLFLSALLAFSTPAVAAMATCTASPGSGPVGTIFTITCTGFQPGEATTAWLTEPDGATFSYNPSFAGADAVSKTDASGSAAYRFPTKSPFGAVALGGWALTVKTASAIGIGRFNLTGGTEGVSGATLRNVDGTIMGSGFAPGEIVTVWFDYPKGDCSATWFEGPGLSTVLYADYKTDAAGAFSFVFDPFGVVKTSCMGTYHIVARGNTSHRGGDTYWSSLNHPVTESAGLVASPSRVLSFRGFISFSGSGFAPSETVTCWETSPQGAVLPSDDHKANGAGEFSFGFMTGADYGSVTPSEGALGDWAMTCRGNSSGRNAIARFIVFGGLVDP
jgi:hypothetical protein